MKRIGYLRVSTADQCMNRQRDGLHNICDKLFTEQLSAASTSRPVYEKVIKTLKSGDIFVIWDLDRAYRSAKDALVELDKLRGRGIEIQIANLSVDTSTPHGMLIYTFISGLAEFERRLLSQRTKEGLEAARKRGIKLGRPLKVSDEQVLYAAQEYETKRATLESLGAEFGVHPWTLTRRIKKLQETPAEYEPT